MNNPITSKALSQHNGELERAKKALAAMKEIEARKRAEMHRLDCFAGVAYSTRTDLDPKRFAPTFAGSDTERQGAGREKNSRAGVLWEKHRRKSPEKQQEILGYFDKEAVRKLLLRGYSVGEIHRTLRGDSIAPGMAGARVYRFLALHPDLAELYDSRLAAKTSKRAKAKSKD